MTANDISGHFTVIRQMVDVMVATDLDDTTRQQVKTISEAGLHIAESVAIDINRMAAALESIAFAQIKMDKRQRDDATMAGREAWEKP